jgi:hypothetical protein
MKRDLYFLFLFLFLVSCEQETNKFEQNKLKTNPDAPAFSSERNKPVATLKEFNLLEEGMTYEEVQKIIGRQGTKIGNIEKKDTEKYYWEGYIEKSLLEVTFYKGKLISKWQHNLY